MQEKQKVKSPTHKLIQATFEKLLTIGSSPQKENSYGKLKNILKSKKPKSVFKT